VKRGAGLKLQKNSSNKAIEQKVKMLKESKSTVTAAARSPNSCPEIRVVEIVDLTNLNGSRDADSESDGDSDNISADPAEYPASESFPPLPVVTKTLGLTHRSPERMRRLLVQKWRDQIRVELPPLFEPINEGSFALSESGFRLNSATSADSNSSIDITPTVNPPASGQDSESASSVRSCGFSSRLGAPSSRDPIIPEDELNFRLGFI
jgi:hypothetical protein